MCAIMPSERIEIDADIRRAWSLPAHYYRDADIAALEKEAIFACTWQVVGHRNQIPDPGDYFTTELVGEPLLVVRGMSGEIRGFYNVCRHRAGPPAQGCGSRKLFRCGYHGWTYGLDGRLISAPEFDNVQAFDAEDFTLRSVRAEEWSGLIFVNLDDRAESLHTWVREFAAQAERFGLAHMSLFERRTYEMKCNWKTYVDNYLEGYHLPSVHPGLNRELDYNAYVVEPYEHHIRQSSPIRSAQPGDSTSRRYQGSGEGLSTDYYWIFPNWMLNCYPDNVSLNIVLPLGKERSLAIFEWYLREEDLESKAARDSVNFSDQIQVEDGEICETVQRNLRSRSYDRGRYSVTQERGVHAFHRMYANTMNRHLNLDK
jgi:choline monooxygenase